MSQEDKILAAIHILTQAKEETAELLKDTPMLSIRVENTMGLLIRGINHANGFNVAASEEKKESKQLSNFFGLDVQDIEKQDLPAVVEVSKSEKDLFMERIQILYDGFLDREDKEIVESVPKLDVLGVAKLAGITVENPASQNITQTFVKSIKKAIKDKNEVEANRQKELTNLNKLQNALNPETDKSIDLQKEINEDVNTEDQQ
ncbi:MULTISPECIES: hypothetical protein [Chryseobacterium]|uniref:Uncharacterized protein n=1 Tax=Chryseobacterium gambrini TaxID=373672 RepID=A0A1N7LF09_9FLAO|nr:MULTISPECIES: hypothetical protein [Chryseobacterium]SIS72361.1 hypothetical protein SAMN05421785_102189 [Chryseobacterium gambrini]